MIESKGTYGTVYKAIHKSSSQQVAIKRISLKPDSGGLPTHAIREIGILKSLKHPNIVSLFEIVCSTLQR